MELEVVPSTIPPPEDVLEIENRNEQVSYPTGLKLWISMVSVILSVVFVGLDMTIVAVAVQRLSDQFETVGDIGWYSAAYMLVYSSFTFLFSKIYGVFALKTVFLASTAIFELGSLLCTVDHSSADHQTAKHCRSGMVFGLLQRHPCRD